jgi:hypothetical protein
LWVTNPNVEGVPPNYQRETKRRLILGSHDGIRCNGG